MKEHIDSLKRQLKDKQFIIESLLADLQHRSRNTTRGSGNQVLVKMQRSYRFLSLEVDDSFKSIKEIRESIENSNEDLKTGKKTSGSNANGNNIVSTKINGNW